MLKGETDKGSWENYLDHIGLFFIFTACAGISNLIGFAGLIIAAVAIFCIILLIKELHGG